MPPGLRAPGSSVGPTIPVSLPPVSYYLSTHPLYPPLCCINEKLTLRTSRASLLLHACKLMVHA